MGTWGTGIFSDDTAMDIRDQWIELFRESASATKATAQLRKLCREDFADSDDGPVAVLALALTLWKYGCLDAATKKRALAVIDKKRGLERWEEQGAAAVKARLKEYAKVKAKLLSKQPASKDGTFKPKVVKLDDSGLRPGDVFSIPLEKGGRGCFRVVGLEKDRKGVRPIVRLLDVPPDTRLDTVDWTRAKAIQTRNYTNPFGFNTRFYAENVYDWNDKEWDRSSVVRHGRVAVSAAERSELRKHHVSTSIWKSLRDCVLTSRDRSEWLTPKATLDLFLATPPGRISALRTRLINASLQSAGTPSTTACASQLNFRGEYKRAMAVLTLGESLGPAQSSPLIRGHTLLGLGHDDDAERMWMRERERVKSRGKKAAEWHDRDVQQAKDEVTARRAGRPLPVPANMYW
jgi:hypothetical protein